VERLRVRIEIPPSDYAADMDEGHARRAGRLAADTATFLHALLYPGSEVRGPREELPTEAQQDLDDAIRALSEAEDALDPGIGAPDVDAGRARLQISTSAR
jgi:hypothetical protein